jgi:hypothetical protein
MKNTGAIWIVLALITQLSSCGSNVDPLLSEQQKAARILEQGSPWTVGSAEGVLSVPTGIDPADLTGLVLSFDSSGDPDWIPASFSASGAEDYLSSDNGRWAWGTTTGTEIITLTNASAAEFTGVVIQEQQLRVTFELSSSGGRVSGIDGSYTLELLPN